jgi:uncharacterized membrane protein YbhN (UPF0104 family)
MTAFLSRWWRYLLAGAAFAFLVRYVGVPELVATLRGVHIVPLLAYLLAFALVPILYGLQIQVALRISGNRVAAVAAAVSAWSVGTLTPARAGDLSLSIFLGARVPEADVVAVVVADKLASLGSLAALACLSTLFVTVPYGDALAIGAGAVAAISVATLAAAWVGAEGSAPGRIVARMIGERAAGTWGRFRVLVRTPRFVAWCFAAATTRWLYICTINLLIFRAVGEAPGFGHVVAATAVGRIISLVPLSVGGVGLKEPAQMVIYAGAGVGPESVVAVSVLGMACGFLIAALAPLFIQLPPAPVAAPNPLARGGAVR